MTKKELRIICKDLRYSLSDSQRKSYDDQIRKSLLEHLPIDSHVGLFLPIEKFKEIDLRPLLEISHINWYAPKCFFEERIMEFVKIKAGDPFLISTNGIPEPLGQNFIDPTFLDVIVIPMLISDESGFRVGYGKGFYDQFLKRCRTDCKRIGVNYFTPVEKISDVDEHDEPIHYCICPD